MDKKTLTQHGQVCFFVINCIKNQHLQSRFLNRDDHYIIIGNPNLEQKFSLEGNILTVKASDSYCGLPEKIIAALEAFNTLEVFKQYTHLYKIDDDIILTNTMNEELYQFIKMQHYCGNRVINGGDRAWHLQYQQAEGEYWKDREYPGIFLPFISGASGYVLSRKSIEKINRLWNISNLDLLRITEIFEDVMIAKVCAMLNIFPTIIPEEIRMTDEIIRP